MLRSTGLNIPNRINKVQIL